MNGMEIGMCDSKISIIVPIYNAARTLQTCVTSLVNQTNPNIQIILVDDGSTDGSSAICDNWKQTDIRIDVIHQDNCGVSAARNNGLDIAQGEYVLFVDSDDELKHDAVETLTRLALQHSADIIFFNYESIGEQNVTTIPASLGEGPLSQEQALCTTLSPNGSKGFVWNKLFRHSLLGKNPQLRFDETIAFCEDLLFSTQAELRATHFLSTDKVLYRYKYNNESAVHAISKKTTTLSKAFERILPAVRGKARLYCEAQYAVMSMELLYWAYESHDIETQTRSMSTINKFWKSYLAVAHGYPNKTRLRMQLAHLYAPVFCRAWNKLKQFSTKNR